MVRYSPSNPMPFTVERMTTASIEPPITQFELASGLLSPSELATAVQTRDRVFIKGRAFMANCSKSMVEDFLSIVRPECRDNGDVEFKTSTDFAWGVAHSLAMKKFGLSHLAIRGTRDRVTGIVIGSIVSYDNQNLHIKRYANVLRAIKTYTPQSRIQYETCMTNSLKCDTELEKKLRDWMNDSNLRQPKRDEHD